MRPINRPLGWRLLCLTLVTLGLAVSAYLLSRSLLLILDRVPGTIDVCSALFGTHCDDALLSPTSWLLGIPIAGWGVVYYGTLASLLVMGWLLDEAYHLESVVAALLLVAVQQARAAARRLQCKNNLKQIGLGIHNYYEAHTVHPPGWIGPNGWAWGAFLLPYIDQSPLYKALRVSDGKFAPPDAGTPNDVTLPVYLCPSDGSDIVNPWYSHNGTTGYRRANYVGVNGEGNFIRQGIEDVVTGVFGRGTATSFADIRDGSSHTIAVGEREMNTPGNRGAIWIRATNKLGNVMYGASVVGTCGRGARLNHRNSKFIGFSSAHTGGAHFLVADGAVRFISENIDLLTYRYLANKSDGRSIGAF